MYAQRAHSAADGLDIPIGRTPARLGVLGGGWRPDKVGQLFGDFVSDGFHGFDAGNAARAHDRGIDLRCLANSAATCLAWS